MHRSRLPGWLILIFLVATLAWAQAPAAPSPAKEASPVPELPADIPASAIRYAVLLAGNRAGNFALWMNGKDTLQTFYEYNDRGRGPQLRTRVALSSSLV